MKKGFTTWAIVIIVALVLIGAGYFLSSSTSSIKEQVIDETQEVTEKEGLMATEEKKDKIGASEDTTNSVEDEDQNLTPTSYSGEVLAGTESLLLDFNSGDYQKALSEKDIVVLYFFANWCPLCKAEFPRMQSVFEKLQNSDVIGFRVSFKDSQTDDSEEELAKEFGVAYQHTKVILKNSERVLKSPETWEEERYLSEINSLLKTN
jgi:thiol-disulfide isomerase/thioredoxin